MILRPVTLRGDGVLLEPLEPEHIGPLANAAAEDRSSYEHTWVPDGWPETSTWVQAALDQHRAGGALPFVARRLSDGRVVGSTRLLDCAVLRWPPGRGPQVPWDASPSVAEIGSTWYAASAQRTWVNTECKLLLLGYAFEVWGTVRVTLKTDARNARSRAAIERLGAVLDGVLRRHSAGADGTVRDTAYYSLLREEWPEVRDRLAARLAKG